MIKLIMSIAKALYAIMRPILKKAVNDPDADWDDILMRVADAIFEWKPEED